MAAVAAARRAARALPVALIVMVLVLPSLVVVPMSFSSGQILEFPPQGFSFRWYEAIASNDVWIEAARNSLAVAAAVVVLSTLIGGPAGIALGLWRWRGRSLFLGFALVPAVMPPMVLALGMYITYARFDLIGYWGLVAAHTVMALPFVVLTVMSSAQLVDPTLLTAAQSLGAKRWRVLVEIVLPMVKGGVATGAIFAFITSWDEVVVAIYLTDPTFKTLPVVMWNQLRERVDPSVAVVATLLFAVTSLVMAYVVLKGERKQRVQ